MQRTWRLSCAIVAAVFTLSACTFDDDPGVKAEESVIAQDPSSNSAPRVSGVPATSIVAGSHYSFKVTANDANGDALTYTATGLPSWAAIDAQTGVLTGTPGEADAGVTADIFISVSDGRASTLLPPFRITIDSGAPAAAPAPVAGNIAPVISGAPAATVQAGAGYTFTPAASDAEGTTLKFSIANKPAWAAFSTSTGTLSGKPGSSQAGVYNNIIVSVTDGSLKSSLPPFSITVTSANGAPVISGSPAGSAASGSSYSFTPSASDPDGDALAFSISGKPDWASFSTATGALTGTAQAGSYANIVISVSDGSSTRSLPAFAVNVDSANSTSLSWTVPPQNLDGTPYTDLAGYRVYHGTSPDNYSEVIELSGSSNTSYAFEQLAKGTHYFAISSYNHSGVESGLSVVTSKTIL